VFCFAWSCLSFDIADASALQGLRFPGVIRVSCKTFEALEKGFISIWHGRGFAGGYQARHLQSNQFTAEDSYEFLVRWFQRFPQYKTHDFHIGEESYADHYVPQLAELVYDRSQNNSKYPSIHFKGFIVGNPETDEFHDWEGIVDYAWTHAIISDQTYNLIKSICSFKLLKPDG